MEKVKSEGFGIFDLGFGIFYSTFLPHHPVTFPLLHLTSFLRKF